MIAASIIRGNITTAVTTIIDMPAHAASPLNNGSPYFKAKDLQNLSVGEAIVGMDTGLKTSDFKLESRSVIHNVGRGVRPQLHRVFQCASDNSVTALRTYTRTSNVPAQLDELVTVKSADDYRNWPVGLIRWEGENDEMDMPCFRCVGGRGICQAR